MVLVTGLCDLSILLVTVFAKQWRKPEPRKPELKPQEFLLSKNSNGFKKFYDEIQDNLEMLSGMDELLAGSTSSLK